MAGIQAYHLDLSAFSERDRFDAFREATSVTHEVVQPGKDKTGFSAKADVWNLGNIVVNKSRFDACRFDRSARRVAADGIDHYTLLYMIKGTCGGSIGTREIGIEEGQVFLLDLSKPVSFEVTQAENVFISIPRDLLDAEGPPGNLHGKVLDGPSGNLLAGFIRLLSDHIGNLSAHEAAFTERATRDLLAACLNPSGERSQIAKPAIDATLLERIREYVEHKLKVERIAPDAICKAVGVSRSTLYRLFEPLGGVAAYIQMRRLMHIRKALADPLETHGIAEIAYRWGFSNPEHFSRAFRRAYGLSPSEFRNDARRRTSDGTASQSDYHTWLRGVSTPLDRGSESDARLPVS
ncbi:MAG: helix-turn-helix domain-containing protein [Terracidiphilus sp.]|jgi:AraC-like DNA-binding protein